VPNLSTVRSNRTTHIKPFVTIWPANWSTFVSPICTANSCTKLDTVQPAIASTVRTTCGPTHWTAQLSANSPALLTAFLQAYLSTFSPTNKSTKFTTESSAVVGAHRAAQLRAFRAAHRTPHTTHIAAHQSTSFLSNIATDGHHSILPLVP